MSGQIKTMTIVSGKGGTGKTTVTASFAALAAPAVVADCDVDAANLHLVLEPETVERHDFFAMPIAKIRQDDCSSCGTCYETCRYGAIKISHGDPPTYSVDALSCEACLACKEFCPEDAIDTQDRLAGEWRVSDSRVGPLVHAHLGVAQENSGRLVTEVRKAATRVAEEKGIDMVIADGPPGIGCAVIASLTGADLVLAVTEATQSGLSDLKRVHDLAKHFKIPLSVLINKADLNKDVTGEIKSWAKKERVEIVGELPYDPVVTKAMISGKTVVEYIDNEVSDQIRKVWKHLNKQMPD